LARLTYDNVEDTIESKFFWAKITAIYSSDDTADIKEVNDKEQIITPERIHLKCPIFYHCKPDAVEQSNKSLKGSSAAFKKDDIVYCRRDPLPDKPKVLTPKKLKPCTMERFAFQLSDNKWYVFDTEVNQIPNPTYIFEDGNFENYELPNLHTFLDIYKPGVCYTNLCSNLTFGCFRSMGDPNTWIWRGWNRQDENDLSYFAYVYDIWQGCLLGTSPQGSDVPNTLNCLSGLDGEDPNLIYISLTHASRINFRFIENILRGSFFSSLSHLDPCSIFEHNTTVIKVVNQNTSRELFKTKIFGHHYDRRDPEGNLAPEDTQQDQTSIYYLNREPAMGTFKRINKNKFESHCDISGFWRKRHLDNSYTSTPQDWHIKRTFTLTPSETDPKGYTILQENDLKHTWGIVSPDDWETHLINEWGTFSHIDRHTYTFNPSSRLAGIACIFDPFTREWLDNVIVSLSATSAEAASPMITNAGLYNYFGGFSYVGEEVFNPPAGGTRYSSSTLIAPLGFKFFPLPMFWTYEQQVDYSYFSNGEIDNFFSEYITNMSFKFHFPHFSALNPVFETFYRYFLETSPPYNIEHIINYGNTMQYPVVSLAVGQKTALFYIVTWDCETHTFIRRLYRSDKINDVWGGWVNIYPKVLAIKNKHLLHVVYIGKSGNIT
jgi:hypothetical protein